MLLKSTDCHLTSREMSEIYLMEEPRTVAVNCHHINRKHSAGALAEKISHRKCSKRLPCTEERVIKRFPSETIILPSEVGVRHKCLLFEFTGRLGLRHVSYRLDLYQKYKTNLMASGRVAKARCWDVRCCSVLRKPRLLELVLVQVTHKAANGLLQYFFHATSSRNKPFKK